MKESAKNHEGFVYEETQATLAIFESVVAQTVTNLHHNDKISREKYKEILAQMSVCKNPGDFQKLAEKCGLPRAFLLEAVKKRLGTLEKINLSRPGK